MGFFSSESKSRSSSDSSSTTQTAGDNSLQTKIQTGKNSSVVAPGATSYTLAKGAVLNITETDNGAINAATSLVEKLVKQQADNTAAALGSVGHLAETKITDGANLTTKSNTITIAVIAAVAGLVALVFIFKR